MIKRFDLNTDDYRNQDAHEAYLERADKESVAIIKAFIFWRAGLQPNEAQRKWLESNTDYAYCDSPEEFYASYGFLDANSHDLTEYGNRVLSEAEATAAMTLYLADCTQNAKNTYYKTPAKITSLDDLKRAVRKDHIAPGMNDGHRSSKDFISADCIMLDLDNTHSDDPDDWRTIDDIAEAFPGVKFYYIRSRNHMKEKRHTASDGTVTCYAPREKDHVYFPLSKTFTDFKEYESLMLKAAGLFPFFDLGAAKPAQFFYGVYDPNGGMESGTLTLDQFVNAQPKEVIIQAVQEFESKVLDGTYTGSDEAEKAVARLTSYLGIQSVKNDAPAALDLSGDSTQQAEQSYSSLGIRIAKSEQKGRLDWLQAWAKDHNVKLGNMYQLQDNEPHHPGAICICVACPWENEHSMNGPESETVIIIDLGGKLSFLCRHSHGWQYGWKDFRAFYEKRDASPELPTAPAEAPVMDPAAMMDNFIEKVQTEAYRPLKTGTEFFDRLLGGGPIRQTLILLLAPPGTGKSALCQQIGEGIAASGSPVVYLNYEMSTEQMLARGISGQITRKTTDGKYTALDILRGYRWTPEDREAILSEAEAYKKNILPNLQFMPSDLERDAESLQEYLNGILKTAEAAGQPAPVLIVDYLHLILAPTGRRIDPQELIKSVVMMLKKYALRGNTFVIAISATNRESNKSGSVNENSGRDSSGIEYTGDVVLTLNYYKSDNAAKNGGTPPDISELQQDPWRQMVLRINKSRFTTSGKTEHVYYYARGSSFYGAGDRSFMPAEPGREPVPFSPQQGPVDTTKKRR